MSKTLLEVIELYQEYKSMGWADSTKRSEKARLNTIAKLVTKIGVFDPAAIFQHLKDQGKKPYTITTTMVRIADLEQWAFDQGLLPGTTQPQCTDFCRRHLRSYRQRAYTRKAPSITYEAAQEKVSKISCQETRRFAQILLATGVRYFEGAQVSSDPKAKITGKGGFDRRAFNVPKDIKLGGLIGMCYGTFLTRLKKATGLKAHDLRKLAATRLAQNNIPIHELMQIMGWKSVETVKSYLQVIDDDALEKKIRGLNGTSGGQNGVAA